MAFVFHCTICGREVYARDEGEFAQCTYCGAESRVPKDSAMADDTEVNETVCDTVEITKPRMTTCPRCRSMTIMPDVRIVDRGEGKKDLAVEVYRKPYALLFRGAAASSLRAWICASCGYTEIYATDTTGLKKAYDEMVKQAAQTLEGPMDPVLLGRLSLSKSAAKDGQLSLAPEAGGMSVSDDEPSED